MHGSAESLWYPVFTAFAYIPRSGMARLYDCTIFNFLRYLHTVFYSGYINLYFYQQCKSVSLPPHPCKHFLSLIFFILAMVTEGRWYLVVWFAFDLHLICISLVISNVEHLFVYLLVFCIPSLEQCPFNSSSHFFKSQFVFLFLSCMSFYIFQILTTWSDIWFVRISLPSPFHFLSLEQLFNWI